MHVAWIGLGRIGQRMAMRVLGAGHDLVGHARTPEKQDEVRAAGGRITTSLTDAVKGAGIVFVNLYAEAQLREVMLADGCLTAIEPGAIMVIHSTVGPAIIRELAGARSDITILDAAFSGTDANADQGTIALMVGGDAAALERARPILATYADYIAHVGPNGAGMVVKLVNNAMFGAQMLIARDAVQVLRASGIDKDKGVEVLARSSGGSFAINLLGHGADPEQRMTSIWPYMEKDVAVARIAARESGLPLGMLEIATEPFIKS